MSRQANWRDALRALLAHVRPARGSRHCAIAMGLTVGRLVVQVEILSINVLAST